MATQPSSLSSPSSLSRCVCVVATLMLAPLASAQGTVETVPVAPITPDLPLMSQAVVQPVPPSVDVAPRVDRDEIRRSLDEAMDQVLDRIKSLDLEKAKLKDLGKIQLKIDESMKKTDWDKIAEKLREASEKRDQKIPLFALDLAQAARGKDNVIQIDAYRKLGGPNAVRGFNAVLVLGDMQGSASVADNVPEAARKALADMKEFLPYRSYRLLDATWILGSGGASSRMRGPDDQPYQLTLQPNRLIGTLRLHVKLEEPEGTQSQGNKTADVKALEQKKGEMDEKLQQLRKTYGPNHPDVKSLETKLAETSVELQYRQSYRVDVSPGTTPVVDTSFDMTVGETVVVGTSRLRGDKALILLLTAVPQPAAAGDGKAPPRVVTPAPGRFF